MTFHLAWAFQRRSRPILTYLIVGLALLWPAPSLAEVSDSAGEILAAVNRARADAGLAQLRLDPLLSQAAQSHVDDMIANFVYGHYGSDGSNVQMRVARTGYSDRPWVSENWVSAGSPAGAMRWWMSDYIHQVNILTPRWQEIGIGVGSRGSEMIFVTVFSAGSGAAGAIVSEAGAMRVASTIHRENVPPQGLDYSVRAGDTLLAIGLRFGLPWEHIAEANALTEHSLLQIGQVIHISGTGSDSSRSNTETELYQVQPGDTLYSIAVRRGLTWQEVAAVNGFGENTVLQIAQVIFVPMTVTEVETDVVAESVPGAAHDFDKESLDEAQVAAVEDGQTFTLVGAETGQSDAGPEWHTVTAGDTVIGIALRHGLDWQSLLGLNGLSDTTLLQVGQRLRLR